jgi:nucleoside-diphosphate-sugar epimerase
LLEAAQRLGVKRFVYPGSIMEYEHNKAYECGFSPLPARHHYHVAKQTARHMLRIAADQYGIAFVPVTISNVYGPRDHSKRLINSLIIAMQNGENMALTAGEQLYDFIYMDDAARAIRLAGEDGQPAREYYIGNKKPRPLKEFLREAEQVVRPAQPLILGGRALAGVSLDYTEFDMGGLYELGFAPTVSFAEGIARTAAARAEEGKSK